MADLAELNKAIVKLDELWTVCTDATQKEELLIQRDNLDAQATRLANSMLKEGNEDLTKAITALKELTELAGTAKDKIEREVKLLVTTADVIGKVTEATMKVVGLLAKL